jgi:serine/threonine protein kinase
MNTGEPLAVNHMLDGRYRIAKMLGQGGMGRVYLANDTRLANRPVACKEMIIGDGIQEQKAVEDFNREARVLASLSHPAIPQVIDYFGERGRHYLVMEFVAGGDLQGHLDQLGVGGRFPEAKVLRWARQILDVLAFLHAQNPPIIYRDLKPGNIMIDHHGRAMIIDFGIARFLPPGGRGTQIGSVGYAPPEQYLGKMEPRSDLYSLAATMHHLLTGRDPQLEPPFSFPELKALAPQVSAQTNQVVMRALEKDVEKRPRSAREMRDLLPDPGPDDSAQPGTSGIAAHSSSLARSGVPEMAAMATIVLNRPIPHPPARPPAPAVAQPNASAQLKTQRSLTLQQPAAPASKAVKSPSRWSRGSSDGRTSSSAAKPAIIPSRPSAPVAANRVSPTAKTRDLGLKPASGVPAASTPGRLGTPAAPAPRPPASGSTSPRRASPITVPDSPTARSSELAPRQSAVAPGLHPALKQTPSPAGAGARNGRAAPAPIAIGGARLVAVSDGVQFGLDGGRAVIGRSIDRADAVDIDLSRLSRGIDRVSRRHAEIIRRGGDFFIRDLGSLNGTYIGGRGKLGRDQLYRLNDRDEIVLGGAKLEFRKG